MSIEQYIKNNQIIIDMWKNRFECLFYWNIKFIYDDENWSHTKYNLKDKWAVIFPCDIDTEDDYLIHEVIKLCFIVCDNDPSKKIGLIQDLVAIIKKEDLL